MHALAELGEKLFSDPAAKPILKAILLTFPTHLYLPYMHDYSKVDI